MKAMILAAGYGTRLGLLGQQLPKPALPVLNTPIIEYSIQALKKAGIYQIVINQHHLGDELQKILGDGSALGVEIEWSLEKEQILGTGGGVKQGLRNAGDEPIVVLNGKIIFDIDLAKVIEKHRESGRIATMVLRRDPDASRWGSIGFDGYMDVTSILSRDSMGNSTAPGEHMFTGIQVLNRDFLSILPEGPSCLVRDGYMGHFKNGTPIGVFDTGEAYWFEHSTPERYLRGNLNLLGMGPSGPFRDVIAEKGIWHRKEDGWAFIDDSVPDESAVRCGRFTVCGPGARITGNITTEESVVWGGCSVQTNIRSCIVTPLGIVEAGETTRDGFTGPALKK
ncbi:NTP transferase domain-containing protein [Myxococcota bacterium]|nr:NTP transferase domain-containing protein [Myxococcota bacterium]MBU1382406.1 NTP transferase domain-containing protein [Myxococcota bacterium]MBU1496565.1 NTP transferase domain-containing protein [Myxococcota bacterium]